MKTYFRLLSFAKPIEKFAIPYVIATLFAIIFNTFLFTDGTLIGIMNHIEPALTFTDVHLIFADEAQEMPFLLFTSQEVDTPNAYIKYGVPLFKSNNGDSYDMAPNGWGYMVIMCVQQFCCEGCGPLHRNGSGVVGCDCTGTKEGYVEMCVGSTMNGCEIIRFWQASQPWNPYVYNDLYAALKVIQE